MAKVVLAAALALALVLGGCAERGREEVERAVHAYLAKMTEAYRKSDVGIVDPLVGDDHGRKLLGLIGVKADAGVALDARLLHLEFTRVAREGDGWVAETRERWYYRDLKLGTDVQVGPDSTDLYAIRYRFSRREGKLVLEDLEFIGQPTVGRTEAPLPTNPKILHGFLPSDEQAASGAGPEPGQPPSGHPPMPGGSPPAGHPPVPSGSPPGRPPAPGPRP